MKKNMEAYMSRWRVEYISSLPLLYTLVNGGELATKLGEVSTFCVSPAIFHAPWASRITLFSIVTFKIVGGEAWMISFWVWQKSPNESGMTSGGDVQVTTSSWKEAYQFIATATGKKL